MITPSHDGATLLEDLPIFVRRDEVLRALGYGRGGKPDPGTAALIEQFITRGQELADPRAIFRIEPVTSVDAGQLSLADGTRFRGAIGQYIGPASHVAIFITTVGPALEAEAHQLMRGGNLLEGAILDAVGSDAAERVADLLSERVAERAADLDPGYAITPRYSPGYCGMHLTQQQPLFAAIDASAVGVKLSDVCLMDPIKSVSGLIGIGDNLAIDNIGTPCQRCSKTDCMMRRE
jgi:hypothetical protein